MTKGSAGNRYWIVVADRAAAEFYARKKKNSSLQLLFRLHNEAARKKTAELITDRGGRSFDSFGRGRHTTSNEEVDPRKHESLAFAKAIRDRIVSARQRGEFAELVLIAAPRFLGELRDSLSTAGADPDLTINKDVVGQDPQDIGKLLEA